MRAIIKFTKGAEIKYISHLDILRMFQRMVMRAGLPVAYSGGYNPHMQIGFACALPTGCASVAEYAELYLEKDFDIDELKDRLNAVTPAFVNVLQVFAMPEEGSSIAASVTSSTYCITLDADAKPAFEAVNNTPCIIIDKKTKKGCKPTDIKPMIKSIACNGNILTVHLLAGNTVNLRPDTLWKYMAGAYGENAPGYSIVRTELYVTVSGKEMPVSDMAEEL